MTPLEIYQQHLSEQRIEPNPYQLKAIQRLTVIQKQLIKRYKKRSSAAGKIRRKIKPRAPIKGLYLWGGVGIGKTYIMDILYDTVPVPKLRMHFHEFMQFIHHQLTQHQGHENPLEHIAKAIADEHLVLFLDEFLVADITDAMILAQLLRPLFYYGTCLITTSNTPPNRLYLNGIQREQFLPAITLLQSYTTVIHQQTIKDYRKTYLLRTGAYFTPLNPASEQHLYDTFQLIAHQQPISTDNIHILGRSISIIKASHHVIWFDFNVICNTPRSQNDYLELTQHYDTFLISNVPIISPQEHHLIIPFIKLVDILYDCRKRLIVSAETTPNQLYPDGKLRCDFERTVSRLIEMGSKKYLTTWHQQSAGLPQSDDCNR